MVANQHERIVMKRLHWCRTEQTRGRETARRSSAILFIAASRPSRLCMTCTESGSELLLVFDGSAIFCCVVGVDSDFWRCG